MDADRLSPEQSVLGAQKQPPRIRFFAVRRWLKEMPRKEDFYNENHT